MADNLESYPWREEKPHQSGGCLQRNTNGGELHMHGDRPQFLSSATEGAAESGSPQDIMKFHIMKVCKLNPAYKNKTISTGNWPSEV